ncbi:MAG: hypothetical protein Q8L59_15440 [Phenylobacterium sp.]|uniref:hypothetical protein n=1 Tax=Phenylobacterium sp. TaxID=1871053 RepID=UPI002732A0C2|nr:hypothetical protein [Phenylobacterium sp.]MDP1643569.1 hypothetical protein [Phenylobacterium sp.]MDP3118479.1 hypothetical protein [Phenylobacterium sp.]
MPSAGNEQSAQDQAAHAKKPAQAPLPAPIPASEQAVVATASEGDAEATENGGDKPSFIRDPIGWLGAWIFDPDNFSDFLMVLFTFALTFVAFKQHQLEERLADETTGTVQTAKDSAEATKLMARVQMAAMRAQVSPVEYQITQVSKAGDPAEAFLVRVGWLNTGATAAQNCIVQIAAEIIGLEVEVPEFFPDEGAPGVAAVPPQLPLHSNYLHIMAGDIDRVIRSGDRLILWSRCDYNDVFEPERTRVSEVCVQMHFMGDVTDLLDGNPNGDRYRFRWQPVGQQNYST